MEFELRIVVEKVAISTQEVVERNTLKVYDIETPQSILVVCQLINEKLIIYN